MAVRIDENVDETVQNVEGAQAQLMRYYKTISSNRWLAMKVFSVLLLFASNPVIRLSSQIGIFIASGTSQHAAKRIAGCINRIFTQQML